MEPAFSQFHKRKSLRKFHRIWYTVSQGLPLIVCAVLGKRTASVHRRRKEKIYSLISGLDHPNGQCKYIDIYIAAVNAMYIHVHPQEAWSYSQQLGLFPLLERTVNRSFIHSSFSCITVTISSHASYVCFTF